MNFDEKNQLFITIGHPGCYLISNSELPSDHQQIEKSAQFLLPAWHVAVRGWSVAYGGEMSHAGGTTAFSETEGNPAPHRIVRTVVAMPRIPTVANG